MNYPLPNQSKTFFRSVGQLENSPEFDDFLQREFPQAASEFPEGVSRRRWIQLMGASLALGGAAGCRYNREEFGAMVVRPEGRVPGVAQYFATSFEWANRAVHLLVTSLEGRPVKLEGNVQHPYYQLSKASDFNDGKENKFDAGGPMRSPQAAILSLYDPDRLGAVIHRVDGKNESFETNEIADWTEFQKFAEGQATVFEGNQGKGLAVIYEPTLSLTLQKVLADVKSKYPGAVFVEYQSIYRRDQAKALETCGVEGASIYYDLADAKMIVAVDDDFLGSGTNSVQNARHFARGRTPTNGKMNRMYCIESQYSVTGAAADFRLAMKSSQVGEFLNRLEALIDAGKSFEAIADEKSYNDLPASEKFERTLQVITTDLLASKGTSLVMVGTHQSIEAQQTAMRINAKLENVGKTLKLLDMADPLDDIKTVRLDDFVAMVKSASPQSPPIKSAWILAPNPIFTVPSDIDLSGTFSLIENVVYLADSDDETSQLCSWVVPVSHPLEAWGDVRSADGTYSLSQPQIEPLLGSRSVIEIVAMLANLPEKDGLTLVKQTAIQMAGGNLSERKWKEIVHAGFLDDSAAKQVAAKISTATPKSSVVPGAEVAPRNLELDPASTDYSSVEVVLLPSDSVYDGRFANNGWLQELPQPITKLTWDNAAIMSIRTARELSVKQGEMIALTHGDVSVKVPVFLVPGHAEGSITLNMGYGRTRAGSVGGATRGPNDTFTVGTNLASLRRWDKHSILTGVLASGTSVNYKLATTQDHFAIADEGGMQEIAKRSPFLVREGTLDEYNKDASFAYMHLHHAPESMWKEPVVNQNHAWGMTIDLNKCIGCNACVVACQAENNVPIVGKEQVSRGREMHWLRIDRYFQCDYDVTDKEGDFRDPIDPKIVSQPMACAHCETAPCEQVCPVAATVHTEEGINAMAYNRCIGTRYCANNCPYKVRRFNYFNYNQKYGYFYGWQDWREKVNTKMQSLVLNPEVSVRGRGVMEKCTYCIQKIQNGKIKARTTGDGLVHDGDIRTACQDACASQAIVFGDLNDKTSRVYQLQSDPRAYGVLEDLNIKPRTKYLARIRNVPARLMTADQKTPTWNTSHEHSHGEEGHDHEHGEEAHGKDHALFNITIKGMKV